MLWCCRAVELKEQAWLQKQVTPKKGCLKRFAGAVAGLDLAIEVNFGHRRWSKTLSLTFPPCWACQPTWAQAENQLQLLTGVLGKALSVPSSSHCCNGARICPAVLEAEMCRVDFPTWGSIAAAKSAGSALHQKLPSFGGARRCPPSPPKGCQLCWCWPRTHSPASGILAPTGAAQHSQKKKKTPSLTSPKPASGALGMLGGVCNWDVSGRRSRRDLAPTSWMLTEDKLCACVCFLLTHPLVMVEDSVPPCCWFWPPWRNAYLIQSVRYPELGRQKMGSLLNKL